MLKNFEVEWNNIEDLSKLHKIIKARICSLKSDGATFASKEEKRKMILDCCFSIYEANLDHIFVKDKDAASNYYIYAHCNPLHELDAICKAKPAFAATLGLNFVPFYVGKGTGDRAYKLERNETYRKVMQLLNARNLKPDIKIVSNNLQEAKALELEAKLIDIFGLQIYGGWLTNLDEGHDSKLRRQRYAKEFSVLNQKRFQLFSDN